jgi:hypothetical protein
VLVGVQSNLLSSPVMSFSKKGDTGDQINFLAHLFMDCFSCSVFVTRFRIG